jgi:hypothetical protein
MDQLTAPRNLQPEPMRRKLLLVATPWFAGMASSSVTGQALGAAPPVSVLRHGADPSGTSDSTLAFTRAIAASDSVFAPRGRYLVGDVELRAGLMLRGEGKLTQLVQRRGSRYALWCDSGSADPARSLRGVHISDLALQGTSDVDGFSEHRHLLNLNGVIGCTVARIGFSAFRGDAVYLGSSNTAGFRRHNIDVTIRDCHFDGVNRENRNAISVIDCDGLEIAGCSFQRVTRDDMPGAIDIEPDANDFHVVRNIRIRNNRFTDIGGNVAAVSLVVPIALKQTVENIRIERNFFSNLRSLAFCFVQRSRAPVSAWPHGLMALDNEVASSVDRPFQLEGVRQVTICRNRFGATARCALVGYENPALPVEDLLVAENRFDHCGRNEDCALRIYALHRARFERNEWIDCGNGGFGSAALELGPGESGGMVFERNAFAAPDGLMRYAIRRSRGHRQRSELNAFTDNRLAGGMSNQLPLAAARQRSRRQGDQGTQ